MTFTISVQGQFEIVEFLSTLTIVPHSKLAKFFMDRNPDEKVLVTRDFREFKNLLKYLRDGQIYPIFESHNEQ